MSRLGESGNQEMDKQGSETEALVDLVSDRGSSNILYDLLLIMLTSEL